ncbi:MAG: hypothetical protein GF346_10525 [Candidatus Eisenbacteria bacterium]|nr:hypothetical protein [Candidatus Latescibacterota bacterium]MBD3302871.1 hypothetical protein [Candidatus Eisenbacteria bacterium]
MSLLLRILIALMVLPASGAATEAGPFGPRFHPELVVSPAAGEIEIDGEIDDPGWAGAAVADGFSETDPGDNVRPPVDTEVLVTYDEKSLYLAFLAYDDPAEVRATYRNRDEIWGDDYIGIILDTFGESVWAYELFVNPLGIQGDLRTVGGEEDMGFDIVWESRGRITDTGYQVEVRVPFASLRFPNRPEQEWRATFWRNRPRADRCRYSWAAMDRDEPCWLCNFGTIRGVREVRAGTSLELLPSLVGFRTSDLRDPADAYSGLGDSDHDVQVSLGARYALSSNLSIEATANPDYSQIESDAAQIDVNNPFALFYPERRPFFQEGSDLFETWFTNVYTRSINDPSVAVKLTGRMSGGSLAYFGARDEHSPMILPFEERSVFLSTGKSTSNVARYRKEIGSDSHLGALATDRRWDDGGSGSVVSVDGAVRLRRNLRLEMQAVASHTEEPDDTSLTSGVGPERFDGDEHTTAFDGETYWGHAFYGSLERDGRHWALDLDYWEESPTFRAANGFITRNDERKVIGWTGVFLRPNRRIVRKVTPQVVVARLWNTRGVRKDEWIQPEVYFELTGQTQITAMHIWSRERYRGLDFNDIRRLTVNVHNNYLEKLRGGITVSHVNHIARFLDPPEMGKGTQVEVSATLKPHRRLVIEPTYGHSSLYRRDDKSEIFNGYVLRVRNSLQFTREASLRLVVQYDRFDDALSVEPLFSYRANPFTILYAGWTQQHFGFEQPGDPVETDRQIFLKFQYLVQI